MRKRGSYTLEISGQTLILHAYGPWNIKTANSMCFDAKQLIKTIHHKPWACLTDITEWELGTPDIWEPVKKLNSWANRNNQKYEVTVCSPGIQKSLIEKSMKTLTNSELAYVSSKEEALEWLKSRGVEVF